MQDGMREQEHEPHQVLRQDVGQHVFDGDTQAACTQLACNGHIRCLLALQDLGADHAREAGPMRERHADAHAPKALAQGIADQDQQDDMRDPHAQIHQPADRHIYALAAQSSRAAKHERDDRRGKRGNQAHEHAGGQAGYRAREHVAAKGIGPKGVLQARRQALCGKIGHLGCIVDAQTRHHHGRKRCNRSNARGQGPLAVRGLGHALFGAVEQRLQVARIGKGVALPAAHGAAPCVGLGRRVRHASHEPPPP